MKRAIQKLEHIMYKKVGKFLVKKPERLLRWIPEDFRWGKRWAMTQPHPYDYAQKLTLWDYLQQYNDSTLIIHELNLRINAE